MRIKKTTSLELGLALSLSCNGTFAFLIMSRIKRNNCKSFLASITLIGSRLLPSDNIIKSSNYDFPFICYGFMGIFRFSSFESLQEI